MVIRCVQSALPLASGTKIKVAVIYEPLQSNNPVSDPGFPFIELPSGSTISSSSATGKLPVAGDRIEFELGEGESFTIRVGNGASQQSRSITASEIPASGTLCWFGFKIWIAVPDLPSAKTSGSAASLSVPPISVANAAVCSSFNGFSTAEAAAWNEIMINDPNGQITNDHDFEKTFSGDQNVEFAVGKMARFINHNAGIEHLYAAPSGDLRFGNNRCSNNFRTRFIHRGSPHYSQGYWFELRKRHLFRVTHELDEGFSLAELTELASRTAGNAWINLFETWSASIQSPYTIILQEDASVASGWSIQATGRAFVGANVPTSSDPSPPTLFNHKIEYTGPGVYEFNVLLNLDPDNSTGEGAATTWVIEPGETQHRLMGSYSGPIGYSPNIGTAGFADAGAIAHFNLYTRIQSYLDKGLVSFVNNMEVILMPVVSTLRWVKADRGQPITWCYTHANAPTRFTEAEYYQQVVEVIDDYKALGLNLVENAGAPCDMEIMWDTDGDGPGSTLGFVFQPGSGVDMEACNVCGDQFIDNQDDFALLDFRNVVKHEMGHGLGFAHTTDLTPPVPEGNNVMDPFYLFGSPDLPLGPSDLMQYQTKYG